MPKYSEQDLEYAAQFREEIHSEALAKVKAVYPCADRVIDEYPVDAYSDEVWEYPGKWYYYVSVPQGAGGRESLIRTIVHDTKEYYRTGTKPPEYSSMGINR